MTVLERLHQRHADELLRFEEQNRAELGFRVAERATGRGVATDGVLRACALARDDYGLHRLVARAALANTGSLGVLRRTGFRPVSETALNGKPALRHLLDLNQPRPSH